jgi:hypothetical protein
LNLYIEDFGKRPPELAVLATSKYLGDGRVLICPADRTGSSLPEAVVPGTSVDTSQTGALFSVTIMGMTYHSPSYLSPLSWPDDQWNRLLQAQSGPGIAICKFHDINWANGALANVEPANGALANANTNATAVILRANLDGTVVRRQVFAASLLAANQVADASASRSGPTSPSDSFAAPPSSAGMVSTPANSTPALDPPWPLFSDDPSP